MESSIAFDLIHGNRVDDIYEIRRIIDKLYTISKQFNDASDNETQNVNSCQDGQIVGKIDTCILILKSIIPKTENEKAEECAGCTVNEDLKRSKEQIKNIKEEMKVIKEKLTNLSNNFEA